MSEFLTALERLLVVLYNGPEDWGHRGHDPREEQMSDTHTPPPAFKAALWHLVRDSAATFAHGFLL